MRILIAHNRYRQPGGEIAVVERESRLLENAGHQVQRLEQSNTSIRTFADVVHTAAHLTKNPNGMAAVGTALEYGKPDIVHLHNTFPLFSHGILDVCRRAGVPVVQTLHNYRSVCANGCLFRDDRVCEKCVGSQIPWAAIHRCYRNSTVGSLAVWRMIKYHEKRKTLTRCADRLIVLSEFHRRMLVRSGLSAANMVVKPHFAENPGGAPERARQGFLYAGRISREKGARVLIEAARRTNLPVDIAGEGPERKALEKIAPPSVRFLGQLDGTAVGERMRSAIALVVPSLWHEPFGLVVVEAYANGLPVIASEGGALRENVQNGVTGFCFTPHDADQLASRMLALANDRALARELGTNARKLYLDRFTPKINLGLLTAIYQDAISARSPQTRAQTLTG